MAIKDLTVHTFIENTGSSEPTPGGGSVAALTASSAAALIEMVANLTLGKEKFKAVEAEMQAIQKETSQLKQDFLDMIDEDCAAFNEIMAAYKLPKNTDEEKTARQAAIQGASKGAALAPFKIGETALSLFDLAEAVIKRGNPMLVTDGAVAVINARAAVKAAFYNVKINLGSIKDEEFVASLKVKMEQMEQTADMREQELLGLVAL
ncbi:cyclodeaminase/cyclohydrolase family protein [uncultured Veillonella sp.]|uniref:cyclodeaminase/cyclohydrolase family protein n=1 Tax=uncultured Veillonella sp. TaxID=159268 RepID=UPI0025F93ECC|nr:cyclodeaminase/cyclohydrolase family protein [uncultured Veillonella sp.]MDY3974146.1 cyclodeaminase/cyclohydrolase family protein [Veillonella caviae]